MALVDAAQAIDINESEAGWLAPSSSKSVLKAFPVRDSGQWVVLPRCLEVGQFSTNLPRPLGRLHDEQAVLCAVELALEAGVATKTHILYILHRLVDGKTASVTPIDAPQALVLRREPQADVGRYDTLMREVRHAS